MGKKPANTYIPHRVVYRTNVLHISYILLTPVLEGLCIIRNHNDRAF